MRKWSLSDPVSAPCSTTLPSDADANLARLAKGFRNALENAEKDGDVGSGADLDDLVAHFVNSVVGVSALLRTKATPEQMYGRAVALPVC